MSTTPAILCDNYNDFEKLNVVGAYTFAHAHNDPNKITGMYNKCAGCGAIGYINFNPEAGRPLWTLECINPITIIPSVHHLDCGWHGWLKNGEWVSC